MKHVHEHLTYSWLMGLADYSAKLIFEGLPHTLRALNPSTFAVHTYFCYQQRLN